MGIIGGCFPVLALKTSSLLPFGFVCSKAYRRNFWFSMSLLHLSHFQTNTHISLQFGTLSLPLLLVRFSCSVVKTPCKAFYCSGCYTAVEHLPWHQWFLLMRKLKTLEKLKSHHSSQSAYTVYFWTIWHILYWMILILNIGFLVIKRKRKIFLFHASHVLGRKAPCFLHLWVAMKRMNS